MRKVLSACLLLPLIFATLALCAPAKAQSFSYFGFPYWNDDYNYGWPANPNNPNFDPAAAAINALNNSHFRSNNYSSPVDFSLIDQMERGNHSAMRNHTARCEARYVTYNRSTDLFIGNDGRPRRCEL